MENDLVFDLVAKERKRKFAEMPYISVNFQKGVLLGGTPETILISLAQIHGFIVFLLQLERRFGIKKVG